MPSEWENRPTISWVLLSLFWLRKGQNVLGNRIVVRGLFSPILAIRFVAKTIFLNPEILHLTVYASVLWSELNWEWKWGLTSLINLVCEGTSQTDLGGWFSSLHALNSTERGGIA